MSVTRTALRDGAIWGVAGAAVLAGHLGLGALLSRVMVVGAIPGMPDAVYIDMEAMPAQGDALDTTPDTEDIESEDQLPEPEPEPEPDPEDVPPPDFVPPPLTELPPLTDFPVSEPEVALPQVSDVRPIARPDRPEPERKVERKKPKVEKKKKPQQQAMKSGRRGERDGSRTKARSGQGDGASKAQVASWQSQVNSRIGRHMRRTRVQGRGTQITITMNIHISANGSASAQLVSSSGNTRMDAALRRQAARLPRLPAPPDGQPVRLTLPVRIVF